MKMPITLYGIIARIISLFVPIKERYWIFGADYGRTYREGSRFLLEYMLENHSDYHCTFITRSQAVKKELDEKNIPCEMNYSLKGMVKIAQAEVIFTTQSTIDILFTYRRKKRRYFFLSHGQPYKAVFLATPKAYGSVRFAEKKGLARITYNIFSFFVRGYEFWDSEFYTSTSDFLVPYNKMYYGENSIIKVLGMPRNDILFNDKKILREPWLSNLADKLVIIYMPTHRDYGHGDVSPIPFADNIEVQEWMTRNDVVLLVKQHPNMAFKTNTTQLSDVLIDITKQKYDPQVCLYHSDALITDYSSVWMDYLILKRPLIFYYYDNFEEKDTGVLYDLKDDPPGHFCKNEDELFQLIKKIKENYDAMRPSDRIVAKYHKYVDGRSCERLFNAIVNQ